MLVPRCVVENAAADAAVAALQARCASGCSAGGHPGMRTKVASMMADERDQSVELEMSCRVHEVSTAGLL